MGQSRLPVDYYYSKTHEWAKIVGDMITVGITAYAVEQMNKDIVSIDLPKVGASFAQGDAFGVIDSVKAAFDIFAPVGLTVTEINQPVTKDPTAVADSPFEMGWLIKGKLSNYDEIKSLMNSVQYQQFLSSEEH